MTESVARVKIQATADLKGFDDLARSLKSLQQAIPPTDAALSKARLEIIQLGYANKQTEKLIGAQINALKSLRTEAQIGGQLYESLGNDINDLKNKLAGTSAATEKAASSFEKLSKVAGNVQTSLQKQGQSFSAFKRQAGDTGKAVGELAAAFDIKFDKAAQNIQDAARQLEALKKNASNIGSLFQGPQKGGGLFEIPRKGLADIQAFSQLVKRLKEQSESAYGKVARISEGLFAVGASGAVVGQVANAFGGVSGAIEAASAYAAKFSGTLAGMGAGIKSGIGLGGLKTGLNEISLLLNQPATGLSNLSQSLGKVQQSLDFLNVPAEAFNNALAALGPTGAAAAGVIALALAKVSEEKRKFLKDFEKEATEGLRGITDETQRLINKLAQLSEAFRSAASMNELQALRAGAAARFNETPAGTDASRRAANTIASAEARIKAESMAQAEVLEAARQRYRGTTESVDALSERLAYLQQAMKYVDQSTAEGKAEFAAFSSEANKVKGQIDQLSNSYRTVADAIRDAARAQGEYANQGTVANYMNRAAVRQQQELVAAARTALSQPQTPLLPAAGQTSFAGTYGPGGIGGGARMGTGGALDAQGRPRGNAETPFIIGTENVGVGTAVYRGAERTEMEIAGAAAALERDMRTAAAAVNNADKAVGELKQAFSELIAPIEKVAKSEFFSPNSINALKARREQIDRERNSVDMLSQDYKRLSAELTKVDNQIERTQTGGLRGKVGYIGQGIGAAASAGIFGGPEGAIGGILGGAIGALGGPAGFAAGAFIGSSAGAYAGMGRQQLGLITTYAADISKLEIALKGVTKTQEEYQRALAASASVTRDFNVPQLEATRGMTQLSAAVIGAGGKVADAEVVFRNVTAAIKASGGTSEDAQGALTALGQVFSKGKVSAEELQGQLGERLPGAVTMFAKATGRTLPQLQKDLEQGVVGLADLMKFITSDQGLGQFEQRAKSVAQSSAEAGARLTTTWNDTKRAIGEALLPLGSELQDAFAGFLRDATPALVATAKGFVLIAKAIGDAASAFMDFTAPVRDFFASAIPAYIRAAAAFWSSIKNDLDSFWNRVGDFFNTLKSIGTSTLQALGVDVEWLGGVMQTVATNVGNFWSTIFDFIKQRWRETVSNMINYSNPLFAGLKLFGIADVGGAVANGISAAGTTTAPVVAGGKTDRSTADTLTDFQIQQQQKEEKERQARDRAAAAAAREAQQQQQTNEALAKAKIALDDAVHRNAMELIRKRYEYEQELANKQRDNWVKGLTGGARTAATLVSQFMGELTDLQNRTLQAMQDVTDAQQKVQSMRAMADVTTGGPTATTPTGGSAIFGATGRVRNAPGWVHGHFQTNVGTLADLIGDVVPVVRQLMQQGIPVELSGGQRFRTGMSDAEIRNLLRVAASQHSHSGDGRSIDLFVPQGTNVPVPLSDVRNTGGRGGVTGMLPGSGRSWIGHLDPRSRSGGGTSAAARRDIAAEGSADIAVAEANKAKEALKLLQDQLSKLAPEAVKGFVLNLTDELRVQNAAMEDSAKISALRNRLQLEGARPEVIDSEVKKAEATQRTSQSLTVLQAMLTAAKTKLDELKAANQENTQEGINAKSQVDAYSQGIEELNFNLSEHKRLTDEATAAQIAFNDAMRFRQDDRIGEGFRDGAQQYVESIGTMREATAQLAQNGIKGVEDAIFSLVTTGTANFKEFAAEILKQTTRMIIQQLILRVIMQAIGAIGGGGGFGGFSGGGPVSGASVFGSGQAAFNPAAFTGGFKLANGGAFGPDGIMPFAMGGIVTKPTLFKFANGGVPRTGLMGEAGPEAIIPLRRGRDGKLGVAGGGNSTNVTVNVDASGSSVQGNAGQGEALGRAISQAVQQELIKQRRPGGLLAA